MVGSRGGYRRPMGGLRRRELIAAGYRFRHRTLDEALAAALDRA
jgi:hypothetical protein